jgi:hypothetical protein
MLIEPMVAALVFRAFLLPGIPIVVAWLYGSGGRIPLYAATISFIWLVSAAFAPFMLAGYYTNLRFSLIYANVSAMLVFGAVAFAKKAGRSLPTVIACLMLSAIWFFVAAINSAV